MNYGKSAYLKVVELEKKLVSNENLADDQTGFLEFDKNKLGETLNTKSVINFPDIELFSGKEICFQIKISLYCENQEQVKTFIMLDNISVHEEKISASSENSEHIIIKSFCPTVSKTSSLKLVFEKENENNIVKIENIKLIIMGLSNITSNDTLKMSALAFSDKVLVSFVDSGRLFYQICPLSQGNIDKEKFVFLSNATSHCFMNTGAVLSKENIALLLSDENKKLKLCFPFSDEQEIEIDENVSFVCGAKLKNRNDQNLIVYVKNGEVYYCTICNNRLLKSRKLSFLDGTFKEVSIATEKDSEFVFLIVTKEDNSSYILRSVIEVETGKFVDFIKAKFAFSVQKYVDMEIADKQTISNLKIGHKFIASPYRIYDKFISQKSVSDMKIKMKLETEVYDSVKDGSFVYGVKLDKNNPVGHSWATYTDDAIGFEKAYMDFEQDKFVSNGWEERWPYCEIKPCLYDIHNCEVIGYLMKDDFTKFENGTNANLTDKENSIVAIEFPKVYMKISTDENFNYIKISNKPLDGFYCRSHETARTTSEHVYVSAYAGPSTDLSSSNTFNVYSGMEIDKQSTKAFNKTSTQLTAFGNCFTNISYPFHILVCALFAIMFKSTDCRKALGVGFLEEQDHYYAGELNQKGMFYGKQTSSHIKLFGLEDYYGLGLTFAPGLVSRSKTKFCWIDNDKTAYSLNYKAEHTMSYPVFEFEDIFPFSPNYEIPIALYGNINFGYVGLASEGNKNAELGFCDPVFFNTSGYCSSFGNKTGGGGLFAMQTVKYSTLTPNTIIRPMHWESFKN